MDYIDPVIHLLPCESLQIGSRQLNHLTMTLAPTSQAGGAGLVPDHDQDKHRTSRAAVGAGGPPDARREPSKEKGTSVVLSRLQVMLVQHRTENGSGIQ